jgi:hypothetical protein
MCGAGRVLVPLATQGAKVHGLDQSAAMLARCEEKLAAANVSTTLYRQDVTQMNVPFRYACAFIAGGAFQMIADPAAAGSVLERVRAHLVPPGLLFIDCRVPDAHLQRLAAPLVEVRMVKLGDGSQIVLRSETTWTPEVRHVRASHRYTHRHGTQPLGEEHETLASTWYGPDDILELVRCAGFHDAAIGPGAGIDERGEAFAVSATA